MQRSVGAFAPFAPMVALAIGAAAACSRFGPLYPPRPTPSIGAPIADPEPARVVAHVVVTGAGLASALDDALPAAGEGTFALLGGERHYSWRRAPVDVSFAQGRVLLGVRVQATVALPLRSVEFPIDVRVEAEPVVSSTYAVKLQAVETHVSSDDTRLAIAERVAGAYEKIGDAVTAQVRAFEYDLRPALSEAYGRIAAPIDLPLGEVSACARLRVLEVEAGPTVLSDGIEKDIALVVAPSVTLPCAPADASGAGGEVTASLPPLFNVAAITPGPFTVTIPIAASYTELTRAMSMAFTDGKLHFSPEYPAIYLEKPEIYEAQEQLVLKLHIAGPVHELGADSELDGDLYLVGHPTVVDNELVVPDLEPTIETRNFLLSLKAMRDGDVIREQARQALRLDIGARVREARDKLGLGMTFTSDKGCFQGDVDRIEVTGVHAHAAYLRVYVAVTARARLLVPCLTGPASMPTAPPPG
jgi:hypothetical protein